MRGRTPVAITAVFSGDINQLTALTTDDYKQSDELDRTAFHAACYTGYDFMLEHMIAALGQDAKYYCDQSDNIGNTPAHYACGAKWEDNNNTSTLYATPIHVDKTD